MEKVKWRLLELQSYDPQMNMAIDEALMYSVADGSKPIIRFFSWFPTSISLAYKQLLDEIDTVKCDDYGFGYVRRPTGGRAIFHHTLDEFSYSVIAPNKILKAGLDSFQIICGWIMDGLESVGLKPELVNKNDILIKGKKIVGSAQYDKYFPNKGRILLQHGSINYNTEYLEKAFEVLRVKPEKFEVAKKIASDYITSIFEKTNISYHEAYSAIKDSFIGGKDFEISRLTPEEVNNATRFVVDKYRIDTEWTNKEGKEKRGFCHLIWGNERDKNYKNLWNQLVE